MPWFKVDDGLHSHPKTIEAGLEAMGLWAVMGSYCSHYPAQRGHVTRAAVLRASGSRRALERLTARLVAVGLWLVDGDGWTFNDWGVYQPTPEAIEAERQRKAAAGRLGGQAKAASTVPSRGLAAASAPAVARPDPTRSIEREETNVLSAPPPTVVLPESIVNVSETLAETPSETPPGSSPEIRKASHERDVFEHWVTGWRKHVGGTRAPVFDAKRKAKVGARLREGFSVEDLKRACDGMWVTPWNQGENPDGKKFNDLELVCRDAGKVERFMASAPSAPSQTRLRVVPVVEDELIACPEELRAGLLAWGEPELDPLLQALADDEAKRVAR